MTALTAPIGNERVLGRLTRAIDDDRSHHCYLFEGPEGVGKHTAALHLALYANCEASVRPCGACRTCRQMRAGSHPDLIVVGCDPDRITRVISVAQAQEVIAALQLQRHSARRRFVILDPADALNEESANKLLKTLEEPPAGTQFVLVTSRVASLLPTIRSRSQRVRFGPVPRSRLEPWLADRGVDPALAAAAEGSPGRALALAEGAGAARQEVRDRLVAAIGQPIQQLFAATEALGKKEEGVSTAELAVDLVEELIGDAARIAAGRPPRHADLVTTTTRWAAALWPGGVARLGSAVAAARERLRLNVNGRIVLEALLSAVNLELSRAP